MFSEQQVEMFGNLLLQVIQQLIGTEIYSDQQLYGIIQKLSFKDRKGIWQSIANQLVSTSTEVHDYFFNTWQLRFYEDVGNYKHQLKQIFTEVYNDAQAPKDIINKCIEIFNQQHPHNQCNERKMYQVIYRYIQGQQSNSKCKKLSKPQSFAENTSNEQISIFQNYAFQKALTYYDQ
ncbi:Conserved_hypothetical protein [Hexamita inflata]|uniref:Uncharacterized protein n=1 Tax=Hexamita inflata TaxID=28002 RepID=A0AA86P038_9EUKA|nr:Conserved hypothetical protein [Hexamita inflata]